MRCRTFPSESCTSRKRVNIWGLTLQPLFAIRFTDRFARVKHWRNVPWDFSRVATPFIELILRSRARSKADCLDLTLHCFKSGEVWYFWPGAESIQICKNSVSFPIKWLNEHETDRNYGLLSGFQWPHTQNNRQGSTQSAPLGVCKVQLPHKGHSVFVLSLRLLAPRW